ELHTCEMGSGDEVQDWTKAPPGRLTYKMKARNGRFKPAGENRRSAYGLNGVLNDRAEKSVAADIDPVTRGHNDVVHQPFGSVAQLHGDAVSANFHRSGAAIGGHGDFRQIRTLPAGARGPDRAAAEPILPSSWQSAEEIRGTNEAAEAGRTYV